MALAALPGTCLRRVSRLYRTLPVGPLEQPDYHNAAVALDAPSGPDPETGALALLGALKALERAFGRQARPRWGPRELDLDLLVFGPHEVRTGRPASPPAVESPRVGAGWLVVPHPEAGERLFVLAPLADIAPRLRPPGWGTSVARARDRAASIAGPAAVRPIGTWNAAGERWDPLDPG